MVGEPFMFDDAPPAGRQISADAWNRNERHGCVANVVDLIWYGVS
jgi:hypothetical protein